MLGHRNMETALLDLLCCPVTRQPLQMADREALAQASAAASRPIGAGLLREDGKVLYPISDGIPLLLEEEAIAL